MDTESAAVAAFSEMYRRARDPVMRYLTRRGGPEVASDLVDEVFTVAWRRWSQVPQTRPLPWLYAVGRRLLANELRSAARRRTVLRGSFGEIRPDEVSGDHSDSVATAALVRWVLTKLPETDREVLTLAAWEGLSSAEIGVVLGCGRATAAVRLHRARRRFRQHYTEATGETARIGRAVPADIGLVTEEGRA
jgi:RNA polymerase sigma-70 factor (ECF subfamily)